MDSLINCASWVSCSVNQAILMFVLTDFVSLLQKNINQEIFHILQKKSVKKYPSFDWWIKGYHYCYHDCTYSTHCSFCCWNYFVKPFQNCVITFCSVLGSHTRALTTHAHTSALYQFHANLVSVKFVILQWHLFPHIHTTQSQFSRWHSFAIICWGCCVTNDAEQGDCEPFQLLILHSAI